MRPDAREDLERLLHFCRKQMHRTAKSGQYPNEYWHTYWKEKVVLFEEKLKGGNDEK